MDTKIEKSEEMVEISKKELRNLRFRANKFETDYRHLFTRFASYKEQMKDASIALGDAQNYAHKLAVKMTAEEVAKVRKEYEEKFLKLLEAQLMFSTVVRKLAENDDVYRKNVNKYGG